MWVHAGRVVRELRPGERLAMERFELRIFSAIWYFGALLIALIAHGALTRGEGERAAERGTGLERGVEADE